MTSSTINFKSNYIKSVQIERLGHKAYHSKKASFVELDMADRNDLFALRKISEDWESSYAKQIYLISNNKTNSSNRHVYVLTTQKKGLKRLSPNNILGIVEYIEDKPRNCINHLQTNPRFSTKLNIKENREYKHVGTSILEALKMLNPNNSIELFSIKDAMRFYKKNGFIVDQKFKQGAHMVWSPKRDGERL